MGKNRKGIGATFQEQTKYSRENLPHGNLDWSAKPAPCKKYPEAIETIAITETGPAPAHELWSLIARRRSRRDFTDQPLTFAQVSRLVWATQGITFRRGMAEFRATPSAGALYPVETYLVVNNVQNLHPGVYHYNVQDGILEKLREGTHYAWQLASAALHQEMIAYGGITFVWTACIPRSKWKYRERCYRYIYLDAGHIGENLCLTAEALGLGCCTVGAFFDEEVNEILGVDGKDETAVYLGVVGNVEK